ncbi:MAG TPA: glutamate--tRNA ligase family protein [Candidatus Paceibacterota bacterium]|nr:glutamate--tRNA ligase family protein [Candidatus Paceibacterota bacterium]
MTVRVRIAPSPTGALHIGTARSALFNWLYARKLGGTFVLRIEDTDLERSQKSYETDIIDGLRWLGLDWDEGPFLQSDRLDIYRSYLNRLMESGHATWREYTDEEKAALAKDGRQIRDRVIVLKDDGDPERDIAFDDMIRGRVSVQAKHVGQVTLAKDEHTPLYNFAVVVDDLEMGITHVIRGEDHISNTPKQLLIFSALGATPPQFAHLPLILGPDRSKMSKRHGSVSITEYQRDYLPDALVNFMAHLGHTFEKDILTREELIAGFDLANVHHSGAIFDQQKLDWMNAQYIRTLPRDRFKELIGHPELPDSAVPLITERLERLSHATEFSYLWDKPEYDATLLIWKNDDPARTKSALSIMADAWPMAAEQLDAFAEQQFDGQKGSVYWPLRVALSGRKNSAGPLDIAAVLGPGETQTRIRIAIEKMS